MNPLPPNIDPLPPLGYLMKDERRLKEPFVDLRAFAAGKNHVSAEQYFPHVVSYVIPDSS